MAYQAGRYDEEERRWRRPCAAATRSVALLGGGGVDWHRPAALLVPPSATPPPCGGRSRWLRVTCGDVAGGGIVARVLVFEYATLLAPCGVRHCAPRGRGD